MKLKYCGRADNFDSIMRLKNEERRIARIIGEIRSVQQVSNRRQKWKKLETRIVSLKDQYAQGIITATEYWDSICQLVYCG
jgi:hypothetical protein